MKPSERGKMPRLRAATVAMVFALATAVLAPSPTADAQPDEITLAPGPWVGTVQVGGTYKKEGDSENGPYSNFIAPIYANITIELVADEDGVVTSGTMKVDLGWGEAGTATDSGGRDIVTAGHEETGQLPLSGTVSHLIADGVVTDERTVIANGDLVEEVSGTRDGNVHWEFRAVDSTCGLLTGWVTDAFGPGLMGYVLVPEDAEDITFNQLHAFYQLWPEAREVDTSELNQLINVLNEGVTRAAVEPKLDKDDVKSLVNGLISLRAELASLPWCTRQELGIGGVDFGDDWMANVVRVLLAKVLQTPEVYTARELIAFLNFAGATGALAGPGSSEIGLIEPFEQALLTELDEAINPAPTNKPLVEEIAAVAGRYALTNLYKAAQTEMDKWAE